MKMTLRLRGKNRKEKKSRESESILHFAKLKELAEKRHHDLDKLKDSIDQLKMKQRCWYSVHCSQLTKPRSNKNKIT